MFAEAVISSFSLDPQTGEPVVVLKAVGSDSTFVVAIGTAEAAAIAVTSLNVEMQQPLTVDLVAITAQRLGARLVRVIIGEKPGGGEVARLLIGRSGGLDVIECRPSDALALAMRSRIPVFVEQSLFDRAKSGEAESSRRSLGRWIAQGATLHFGTYYME